jgi:hypothetical protein
MGDQFGRGLTGLHGPVESLAAGSPAYTDLSRVWPRAHRPTRTCRELEQVVGSTAYTNLRK